MQKPSETVNLAMTPTPVHEWRLPGLPEGVAVHVKRDDMTGMQMSGNKVCESPLPSLLQRRASALCHSHPA